MKKHDLTRIYIAVGALAVTGLLMLLARKDFRPEVNTIPKSLAILAGLGVIALCINLLLGTNFMFLMFAPEGNPLYFFYQLTLRCC